MKNMNLSKILYMRGLQCKKSLWLKKNKSKVLTPVDSEKQSLFNAGYEFGAKACKLFPNGKEIIFKGSTFNQKLSLTKKWIDEGIENIYEATFQYQGILVMVDILHVKNDGSFEIYEAKHSKYMRDVYIDDASIQYYVISGLGYKVSKVSIVHRNDEDENEDATNIFSIVDVTNSVISLQENIEINIDSFKKVLAQKREPKVSMGNHCTNPYPCDAIEYCSHTQTSRNIFDFFR